ncbi:hypothetical protein T440DRAFT_473999 [Plenodomus tracheiphilus IPT5]|uniref:Uncharacterized protein n=1 Tax=Plenodomus tracheiphilus IPT5 TaxID=1408161 RepID=A0A6A7BN41_9PLEO|nr:hypothetical protein T440DRAFT_473999 [Plenodomus tracheiphilus IPT5]
MTADLYSPDSLHPEPVCYFSIPPAVHFSLETPLTTPCSEYQPHTPSDPSNPLLACRPSPPLYMSSPSDASRLLQLQTQAAHRPSAEPLQQRASSTSSTGSNSSTSSNSMASSSQPCCCRCRRESYGNMFQIGTNRYYCSHCAKMTGYSAG